MVAASLGTWCLALYQVLHACSIAWHVMPRFTINGWAHGCSITWLVMPRFESAAARMAAAGVAWLVMHRFGAMAARTAAASPGT
jgi:hypothetical protein